MLKVEMFGIDQLQELTIIGILIQGQILEQMQGQM